MTQHQPVPKSNVVPKARSDMTARRRRKVFGTGLRAPMAGLTFCLKGSYEVIRRRGSRDLRES